MKVNYKQMISGYTGRGDGAIFVYDRRMNRYYMRNWPHRKIMEGNQEFSSKMANLSKLNPDAKYKEDLQMYLSLYNDLAEMECKPVRTWSNLFMKLMFGMAKSVPGIDLSTLTKAEIYDQSLPCKTVKDAIEAGLLPMVRSYQRFNNGI